MTKLTLCSFAPRNLDDFHAEVQLARKGSSQETTLRTLVRLRVSQIAGCEYGIVHFWKEGADAGEDLRRLNALIVLPSILERRPSYHDFHYFF